MFCATIDMPLDFLDGHHCGVGQVCNSSFPNPNYGYTNFDNIFWAFLQIFQVITLEGWSKLMEMVT